MTRMDWSKIGEHDARRRNAPLRQPTRSRFVMRSKHAGLCKSCGLSYKPLDPITPVEENETTTHWVHWSKKNRCATRLEARFGGQRNP